MRFCLQLQREGEPMDETDADENVPLNSILEKAEDGDSAVDGDPSTVTDAGNGDETRRAESHRGENASEESITQSRRGFGKLMLAGTAGALGLSQAGSVRAGGSGGWRQGYRKYVREYMPAFYSSVPKKENLYRCVKYVAENTGFWDRLGEKMYLDQAVVTAAYAYPVPNYKRVERKAWDGILSDMYADMPKKYRKRREYPIAVPVVVAYLYDGYYNAVAYLRPYGSAYKSYAYVIKSGYYQQSRYDSKSEYASNTWWMTEDGWGDAGDTDGGILDGVPTGLTG